MRRTLSNPDGRRVIKRFALLPITLRVGVFGLLQWRWLETVWISQERLCGKYGCSWEDAHFVGVE